MISTSISTISDISIFSDIHFIIQYLCQLAVYDWIFQAYHLIYFPLKAVFRATELVQIESYSVFLNERQRINIVKICKFWPHLHWLLLQLSCPSKRTQRLLALRLPEALILLNLASFLVVDLFLAGGQIKTYKKKYEGTRI